MEPLTATAIVTLLFSEAIKEGGKAIGNAIVVGVASIFTLIRQKLQDSGTEGLLARAEKQPTDEKSLGKLADELQTQLDEDKEFSEKLQGLIKEVVANEPSLQLVLKGNRVKGSLKAKDISQESSRSGTQEILTDVEVGGDIDLGNLTQKN